MSEHERPSAGVSPELLEWIERFGGVVGGAEPGDLCDAALRALDEAAVRTGRTREAAFALLAADALITEAVGRLAETEDPEAELLSLIDRIASATDEGPE